MMSTTETNTSRTIRDSSVKVLSSDASSVHNMNKSSGSPSILHSLPWLLGWVWLSVMGPMFAVRLFSKVAHAFISRYCYSKDKLAGKVVLVTGASSGVGAALCRMLYKRGCRLIMAARSRDRLEALKADIIASCKPHVVQEPIVLELDITDLKNVPKQLKVVLQRVGGSVDILINNAGQSFRGEAADTFIDVDLKLMLVNYFGHVAVTKEILPGMIAKKSGHIVSVSSIQGQLAIPFRTCYCASKHALQGFMDSLRAEVSRHNISVSVVSPSYINTQLSMNALTSDGSTYGVMDKTTSSGMSPDYVATRIEAILESRDEELILAPMHHKLAMCLRFFTPSLFNIIMKYRAAKGFSNGSSSVSSIANTVSQVSSMKAELNSSSKVPDENILGHNEEEVLKKDL